MAEHKHAKILRAIADNADVELEYRDDLGAWRKVNNNELYYALQYASVHEYRIKPTIVKKWKWVYAVMDCGHEYEIITGLMSEAEFMKVNNAKSMVWFQKIDATITEIEE